MEASPALGARELVAGSNRKEKRPVDAPLPFVLDDPLVREQELRASMDSAIASLAQQLADGHTDGFKEVMAFYARFWSYSVRNCLLIHLQCPHATRCAGRYLWNQLGYHIERGQKAIWIWAPILKKELDPTTDEVMKVVAGFRPAPVFDFSQMAERAERPLPQVLPVLPDDQGETLARCIRNVERAGIVVEIITLPPGTDGVSRGGAISINGRLDSRNQLFVLLHELVHELWHAADLDHTANSLSQKEFEAEAVAYVAAAAMGLEHPSARDYLLHWHATAEDLQTSLLVIQMMVRKVLVMLELTVDAPPTPEAMAA